MLHICSFDHFSTSYSFGGKAKGLNDLFLYKLNVPESLFIEATDDLSEIACPAFQQQLFQQLAPFKNSDDRYDIAVRSSALNEDGDSDSFAGHYESILGLMTEEEVLSAIKRVILSQEKVDSKSSSTNKMGVVLQRFIRAEYSGVIFSSNPFTFSKKECLVSFTSGCGEKLVSGEAAGTDVMVTLSEKGWTLPDPQILPFGEQKLFELCKNVKDLERFLGYPLDVEWTIQNGVISYIQCRPLTAITKIASKTVPVKAKALAEIPQQLLQSDKVSLRLDAHIKHAPISDAYIIVNNTANKQPLASLQTIRRSSLCQGYSAVVIYPKRISEKVVRAFIGDTSRLRHDLLADTESKTNASPKYADIADCAAAFSTMANEEVWISSIIVQEIYSPTYTGVVKKEGENVLFEIIKGHFFTKGTLPSSNYLVSPKGEILSKQEVCQDEWYEICEGTVIEHLAATKHENSLSNDEVQSILQAFDAFLQEEDALIEFGLLEINQEPKPYLIDLIKNEESLPELSVNELSQGILSRGKRTGKLLYVELTDEDSFDLHFHNAFNESLQNNEEPIIFACKKTSIELLRLIYEHKSTNIGFLFESGSILCHLSVVLREKEIPAIQIGSFDALDLTYGAYYTIDAESASIDREQRVRPV